MKLGILGLPGSGKTTLFRALTGLPAAPVDGSGLPGTRLGVVQVPDARLGFLARVYQPKKTTPASFDCLDVTGLVQGTGRRPEVSTEMLARVRELDAFVLVLREFADARLPHFAGSLDPARDRATIESELLLADLELVERRAEKLRAAVKKPTPRQKQDAEELVLVERAAAWLGEGRPARELKLALEEAKALRGFQLLTGKPCLLVLNVGAPEAGLEARATELAGEKAEGLAVAAKLELEISELDPGDRGVFLADLGIKEPAAPRLIHAAYRTLGLISFLTYGPDEVRAWTVNRGATAVEAAGKIHTDLARGFIRAETAAFADVEALGDVKAVRAAGKLRSEGREYVVQDGDLLTIRFSV